jgi:hypothetical protein
VYDNICSSRLRSERALRPDMSSRWSRYGGKQLKFFAAGVAFVSGLILGQAACAQGMGIAANRLGAQKHLDFAGKPCLTSEGISRALASNPRIVNHAVSLNNKCSQSIRAKLCYYDSDECTNVTVPARSTTEQIIGVFPAMQTFRYEVKELF